MAGSMAKYMIFPNILQAGASFFKYSFNRLSQFASEQITNFILVISCLIISSFQEGAQKKYQSEKHKTQHIKFQD